MPEITGTAAKTEVDNMEAVGSTESIKPTVNGTSENGVTSTSPEKKSPEKNEGELLLAQGKRHLYVKDYPNAVASLGDACAKLAELHGELADECADAYFSYGRALLELAREESSVLRTEPETEDSEEDDEEEMDDEEDNKPKEEDDKAETKLDGEQSKEGKGEDENVQNEEKECPADETIDTTKEVNEEGEGNEEDIDNLELAWEVFELAKKIFHRQESQAKLAETYLYLGEVGLESENYNGAIDDMKQCVDIQKKILPSDHRDIAETYFQLGVACSLCNEFNEAIVNFKTSSEILEARIKNLEENGAPESEIEKNPFYTVEKEVGEIKALLPEIMAKIADMQDVKQETIKNMMATLKEQPRNSDGAGPSSSASSSVPVANGNIPKSATNISHLIHKKRKPEEDVPTDNNVKKACTEDVSKVIPPQTSIA